MASIVEIEHIIPAAVAERNPGYTFLSKQSKEIDEKRVLLW